MYTLYFIIVLTALVCRASAMTEIQNKSLTYECTKDGTIIITANDKALYGSIYAEGINSTQSRSTCPVDRSENASMVIFIVTKCNVSLPINVTIMKETQKTTDDMVVGGRNVTMYELKCSDIRLGGSNITKVLRIFEKNEMNVSIVHQTELKLTMTIRDKTDKVLDANKPVMIGDELHLKIEVNTEYMFLVHSCIATDDGSSRSPHAHSKQLIIDGKSNDTSLITTNDKNQTRSEFNAVLYAFHFVKSNNVTITCEITVCKEDDNTCSFNTSNANGRRKRSASTEPHTNTLKTSFTVIDSYTQRVGDPNKSGDDQTDGSNMSSASTERRSFTVSLILLVAFGSMRILS